MKKAQFAELLESVREMKAIEKGLKKPSRVFEFPPPNARQIRRKFHLSQPDFARLIGISVSTLRNWEQGLRVPEGPAQVLLRVVAVHPEAVFEVCAPPRVRAASAR
jgi:putative transcriptional regulator